jgi:hypothetical protein
MLDFDIKETGHSGNLDIREKKGGPLDSLISRFDCIVLQYTIWLSSIVGFVDKIDK